MDYKQSLKFSQSSNYRQIKRGLSSKKDILECAEQLGVVGDPTRLKICYLLCHYPEMDVTSMADVLGTSVSVVSHSLKKLLKLELVKRRKDAQTVYYSLTKCDFTETLKDFIS